MISKHCEIIREIGLSPKTILEVGSRDGHDAEYYRREFDIKSEDTYLVEPNPNMIVEIKKTYPNFILFEYAIDKGEDSVKEFNQVVSGDSGPIGTSSLLNRRDEFYSLFETNKIKVNSISGESLMKKIGKEIDICKIDVEGLTHEVLESFDNEIKKIKTLHVETENYPYWIGQKLHDEVFELLGSLNFKLAWLGKESYGQFDSVWINSLYYGE